VQDYPISSSLGRWVAFTESAAIFVFHVSRVAIHAAQRLLQTLLIEVERVARAKERTADFLAVEVFGAVWVLCAFMLAALTAGLRGLGTGCSWKYRAEPQ